MEDIKIERQKKDFEATLKVLDRMKNKENKKLIYDFLKWCDGKGIAFITKKRYAERLMKFSQLIKKGFAKIKNSDMLDFFNDIVNGKITMNNKKRYSNGSVNEFKKVLKLFYNSFLEKHEIMKSIKNSNKLQEISSTLMDEILDNRDKLLDVITNYQDKAFFSILVESGMNFSEINYLRLKDCRILDDMIEISITESKTTSRNRIVRIITYQNHVLNWLNNHPFKDNQEAYLFIKKNKGNFINEPSTYQLWDKKLKKYQKLSGFKNHVSFHKFRHAVTTWKLRHKESFGDIEIKKSMGWSLNSNMIGRYSHLNDKDLRDAELKARGLEKTEKIETTIIKCQRCGKTNSDKAKFCALCGFILHEIDREKLKAKESENTSFDNALNRVLLKHPNFERRLFMMTKKEMKKA